MACFSLVITFSAFGQSGCYVPYQDKIYIPIRVVFVDVYILSNGYSTTCPIGSTRSTLFYSVSSSGSTSCTVLGGIGGALVANGVIRSYSIMNCPIDDYAWFLIASSASIAFLKIRKKKD